MKFELSSKTKKSLSEKIGVPYEELVQMEEKELNSHIEKK